jgi:hypothetical protein
LRQAQAGPDQHRALLVSAPMAGTAPAVDEVSGSASMNSSRQGAAGAAVAALAPNQQEEADVTVAHSWPSLPGSLPDGQEQQQQGVHPSSRWVDVVTATVGYVHITVLAELMVCSGCCPAVTAPHCSQWLHA